MLELTQRSVDAPMKDLHLAGDRRASGLRGRLVITGGERGGREQHDRG